MTAHEYVEQTAENRVALFFQHIWGVMRRPRSTIEILVERRPIREALMIFLILAVLSGISRGLLTSEAYIEAFDLNFYFARLTLLGGSVLIALFAYLVPFSLMAGGFWVMIRILGGRFLLPHPVLDEWVRCRDIRHGIRCQIRARHHRRSTQLLNCKRVSD